MSGEDIQTIAGSASAMRKFRAMFKARSMEFFRDRGTLLWNILLPVLLVFGFAFAFGGNAQTLFKVGVIGTPDPSLPFMQIKQIQFIPYSTNAAGDTQQAVLEKLKQHKIDMVLDFNDNTYYINRDSSQGPVLKRLLFAGATGTAVGAPRSGTQSQPLFREQQVSGAPIRYVDWVVPGIIGMNMMFSSLFGVGFVIVRYRKNGVLKRLKATPVSAVNFVTAQALSRLSIVVVTSAIVYVGTDLFLHFMMKGSYLNLLLLTALATFCMITLGLVFAARLKSEELANGLMNLITLPMVIFSGVFFSLEGSPKILQKIAEIFPLTHFVNGARDIMLNGATFVQILPQYLILAGFSALFLVTASLLFRWE
ncbi:MAG TPA: ABC transporter permease [Spirochaetia bacterium]|nr:ABC transporter permease [Spirochaetia bacterium]